MADSVYKVIELVGTSTESWEKAAGVAVEQAAKSLRDLRIAESDQLLIVLERVWPPALFPGHLHIGASPPPPRLGVGNGVLDPIPPKLPQLRRVRQELDDRPLLEFRPGEDSEPS